MKNLLRALNYFRADAWQIGLVVILLLFSIGLNVLKPWPLALVVDCVLGGKPLPAWVPKEAAGWGQAKQLAVLIGTLLALHLGHATISALQLFLSIRIGLRGLCRVRNDVFGWLQRLSLRWGHNTDAGDIIFRAGTDTCAFQPLFQQGSLMLFNALCTLTFMLMVMFRLNVRLTLLALVAVPFLLVSIKVFGRVMRDRGLAEVTNPSAAFLTDRVKGGSGSSIVVTLEGTRPMLVEVQALVNRSALSVPRRVANARSGDAGRNQLPRPR